MYLKIIDEQVVKLDKLPRTFIHDNYITFNPSAELMGYTEYPEIEQEEGYRKYYGIVDGEITVIREEIPEPVVEEIVEEVEEPTEEVGE